MPPTGRTASRPLPSAAPAERRQSFHREPGDVSSGNVYQRFTRRLSNAKKPAQDLNINDEADDLFSSVPTTPREKPANVEAFELQEQQGSRTSDTAAPDSNLRRKGSLLDKLDNSSRKGSVESNVPTEGPRVFLKKKV